MAYNGPQIVISFVVLVSLVSLYITSAILSYDHTTNGLESGSFKFTWMYRLMLNLLGYAMICVPGYLIFKYVHISKYLERSGGGLLSKILEACIVGNASALPDVSPDAPTRSFKQDSLLLIFCFVGLQGSYLTWGILQEKVMTQEYTNSKGEAGKFKDSQFLVFVNRILALSLSGSYLIFRRQPNHSMPLHKYAYCSFSNIMSSWCQYESLKFVSFPTQVLAKASKLIPVMVMGKLISRRKYEYYEYITATLISFGMTFFMVSSVPSKGETVTTMSGVVLLAAYMLFDSFTSNWQDVLFTSYHISPVRMMCGVNLFSCLFTAVSLFQQGAFPKSFAFMTMFPKFVIDCILISISSGAGQLFIFFTISCFGPVVFTIIMTIRQGLAILLSCLLYNHSIPPLGVIGILVVFLAVFLRLYCNQRLKSMRGNLHYSTRLQSSKV